MSALKILHFADAHIDIANYGRHDPATGLPVRVLDFLKSLDEIVDTAIAEKVDLVLFAGDAYKDRNPAPTFQREWGRRIIRLSKAKIPTLLLIGNHDLSPSLGRANALEEYRTLEIPYVKVLTEPGYLGPDELWNLPVQVVALPWVGRSQMVAALNISGETPADINAQLEERLTELVKGYIETRLDPKLPSILLAHASVQGAIYGSERSVMLGNDVVLPGSLVRDKRLDYVALGHIHKAQDLNENKHPPVIYPGSIERVDFGEVDDEKFFVLAELEKGSAQVSWRKLAGIRPYFDRKVKIVSEKGITQELIDALPSPKELEDAIVRMSVEYPREWEALIDEAALRENAALTLEFHLVKRPIMENRMRIPENQNVGELSAADLLELYWKSAHVEEAERATLAQLAREVIESTN
jgi:exonuclease SbcD